MTAKKSEPAKIEDLDNEEAKQTKGGALLNPTIRTEAPDALTKIDIGKVSEVVPNTLPDSLDVSKTLDVEGNSLPLKK
jgi:hypothetical protein